MYDVVIVGAGIAGLGAARVLTRESCNIVVLEARSRPGGRIHSVRLPSGPVDPTTTSTPLSINHDNLSVFHTVSNSGCGVIPNVPSHRQSSAERSSHSTPRTVESNGECGSATFSTDLMGPIDVDLGANYLIGCSNRQTDQPLFHMARMLKIPTATCVGDLCKKYRGWECAELSTWRDHRKPGAPIIPLHTVAEAAFLFDKVVHLAVHRHLKLKSKVPEGIDESCRSGNYGANEPSVKELIDESLQSILHSEANFGLRSSPTLKDEVESGVFHSILMRYLAYVNPIDRLPHTVLDELCEVATPRWHLSMNGSVLQSLGLHNIPLHKLTLSDRLALAYPSHEQREAYLVWAERKLCALFNGQSGSFPSVARTVGVSWEDRLVTGRFSDLLRPLMENVPIIYNAIVYEINWALDGPSGEYVRVRALVRRLDASSKSEFEEVNYEAKHCIVTVPVGVLKGLDPRSNIDFIPALPRSKRDAIHRLGPPFPGAPTHEKVILRFRAPVDVFWDTQAAHLKCPDPRLHILNLHRYGKPGVLCAHIWGGSGLCPAGHSDQELVDVILDLLDQMYPTASTVPGRRRGIPDPVCFLVTRWSEDPFSLGAYTTGEPGSSDLDRLIYATSLSRDDAISLDKLNGYVSDHQSNGSKPCPRLLFAGEGTLTATEAKECTHGALQTGVLRALEILPFLHKSTNQTLSRTFSKEDRHSRALIVNKLAQYLVGKPMPRWLAGLHSFEPRPGRANRATRSVNRSVSNGGNGIHQSIASALDLNGVSVTLGRRHHEHGGSDSDDTLPLCIQKDSRPPKARCTSLSSTAARRRNSHTRTKVLCQRPRRVRRTIGATRKRKVRTSQTVKRSVHCSSSDSSSTTMEACSSNPIVLVENSLVGQRCIKLAQVSSSLHDLSASWHLFTFSERQQILHDLSDLLDELRVRHDELERTNCSYAQSSPLKLHSRIPSQSQIPSFPLN